MKEIDIEKEIWKGVEENIDKFYMKQALLKYQEGNSIMNTKDSRERMEEWIKRNDQLLFENFTLVDLMAIGYELGYNDGVKQGRKYKDETVFKRKEMV